MAESSCTGGVDPRAGAGLPGLHAISSNIPVIAFAREDSFFGTSFILGRIRTPESSLIGAPILQQQYLVALPRGTPDWSASHAFPNAKVSPDEFPEPASRVV